MAGSEVATTSSRCQVEWFGNEGFTLIRVQNDRLQLTFLPDVGGRLMSLCLDDTEFLWRNPEYFDARMAPVIPRAEWKPLDGTLGSWANVGGSKTWPAPQGWTSPQEWPGPPDAVLDSGPYAPTVSVRPDGSATLQFVSAMDARTGLQVERNFEIPATGTAFTQRNRFLNLGADDVCWSIWEVAQVDTDIEGVGAGEFVIPQHAPVLPLPLVRAVGEIPVRWEGDVAHLGLADCVGKLGLQGACGAIEWIRPDGARLVMESDFDAAALYPDGGCSVEVWMQSPVDSPIASLGGLQPNARLVEMELLSPLTVLRPAGQVEMDVRWSCHSPG